MKTVECGAVSGMSTDSELKKVGVSNQPKQNAESVAIVFV